MPGAAKDQRNPLACGGPIKDVTIEVQSRTALVVAKPRVVIQSKFIQHQADCGGTSVPTPPATGTRCSKLNYTAHAD